MTHTKHPAAYGGLEDGSHSSDAVLLSWGDGVLAYVKHVTVEDEAGYAIHAADGRPLGVVRGDRDVAFAVVRQNDLEPVSVH